MKLCTTCHELKQLSDFNVRRSAQDGRQPRCRDCCRAWYAANAERHKAAVAARVKSERVLIRQRIAQYLQGHPCVDCGEHDVRCLEFDHRLDVPKSANIADLIGSPASWRVIDREIAKCDVRCANCHRRRTAERGNHWRQQVHEETERVLGEQTAARLAGLPRPFLESYGA